jgi:arylsulfatase
MSDRPVNVVVLTVDALRADHCSGYGYDRATTPRLDGFAAENTRFERAYSPSSHTREAVPSLLTGRYPDEAIGADYRLAAETLAERLQTAGYRTGAFHSNPYCSRAYGFDAGFDTFDDDLRLGRHRLLVLAQRLLDKVRDRHYARAETINERALSWLDAVGSEPLFCWVHYMDVHGPYEPPAAERTFTDDGRTDRQAQRLYKRAVDDAAITDDERRDLLDRYDDEIRAVDAGIGALLDALAERGLRSETLVVVTADHGDAFGEHGYYGHPRSLHDELVHVPLVVAGPDGTATSVDAPVSTLDVAPTILDAAGLSHEDLPGQPLETAADCADRPVFSMARGEGQAASQRRFSARSADGTAFLTRDVETGEVVDRETGEASDTLVEALESFSADHVGRTGRADAVDDETAGVVQDRLDALGYTE